MADLFDFHSGSTPLLINMPHSGTGSPLYASEEPLSDEEMKERLEQYWRPYHKKLSTTLAEIKETYGYALLYDAHSIASRVPNLFKGKLPDLNLGTANADSCSPEIGFAISEVIRASDYTSTVNGRFVGGYITRFYGKPNKNVHAAQMEISQVTYMDEDGNYTYNDEKADKLIIVLNDILNAFLGAIQPEEKTRQQDG